MGHQRLLQSRHGQEAARLLAQRKMHFVWFLAVIVPFAILFFLFPSPNSSHRAKPLSAPPKPTIASDSNYHREQLLVQESTLGQKQSPSKKSGDKLQNRKSRDKKAEQEPIKVKQTADSTSGGKSMRDEKSRIVTVKSKQEDSSSEYNVRKRSNKKPPASDLEQFRGTDDIDTNTEDTTLRSTAQRRRKQSTADLLLASETDDVELESIVAEVKTRRSDSNGSRKKKRPIAEVLPLFEATDAESEEILPATSSRSRATGSHGEKEGEKVDRELDLGVGSRNSKNSPFEEGGANANVESGTMKRRNNLRNKATVQCDLSKGKWIPDNKGPPYTNETCPWIEDDQNCMKNISKFQYWKWKPDGCELERFRPKAFLKMMKSKALAYVGDSSARSQMQSLVCLLAQVEKPKKLYDDKENRSMAWHFPVSNVTLTGVWSPYLVQETWGYVSGAPEGVRKLRLDMVDPQWGRLMPGLEMVVLSVTMGEWEREPGVYVVKNEMKGCHAADCKDPNASEEEKSEQMSSKKRKKKTTTTMELGSSSAFRAAIRSSLMAVTALPGFQGVTILAANSHASPSCKSKSSGRMMKTIIANATALSSSSSSSILRDEVRRASERGIPNGSRLELLDASAMDASSSSSSSSEKMIHQFFRSACQKSSSSSQQQQQDCLPGAPDAWNQVLLAILNRPPSSPPDLM